MNQKHPLIAKEGWPFIGLAFVVALAVSLLHTSLWITIPLWIIFAFVLQFFRDPIRIPVAEALDIVSPADGKVIIVEEKAHDPYLNREATRISVFMNVFNVHSNRLPVDGTVVKARYFPGKFFNADLSKASEQDERNALVLTTPDGQTVTSVQVAGLIARRILCYVGVGHVGKRGERYGFIRFGSRVDVYLPLDAMPKVAIGDKVSASSTILAILA